MKKGILFFILLSLSFLYAKDVVLFDLNKQYLSTTLEPNKDKRIEAKYKLNGLTIITNAYYNRRDSYLCCGNFLIYLNKPLKKWKLHLVLRNYYFDDYIQLAIKGTNKRIIVKTKSEVGDYGYFIVNDLKIKDKIFNLKRDIFIDFVGDENGVTIYANNMKVTTIKNIGGLEKLDFYLPRYNYYKIKRLVLSEEE
jgi:hypothetical protein